MHSPAARGGPQHDIYSKILVCLGCRVGADNGVGGVDDDLDDMLLAQGIAEVVSSTAEPSKRIELR